MPGIGDMLIINGSIRGCASEDVIVRASGRLAEEYSLFLYIEEAAQSGRICNTEGCGVAVAYGAQKEGITPRYLRLNEFIDRDGEVRRAGELLSLLASAHAYVFLTPVYFGDRSSLVHDLMLLMKREGLDLTGKVSAVASVGAKRNGGQETTNIFTLHSLMQMNSLVVGNGPPTSQYGGTAVGGNMGAVATDHFGLHTSIGVGYRIARAIELLRTPASQPPTITFCVLEDTTDRRLLRYLNDKLPSLPESAHWRVLDTVDMDFDQCQACDTCPKRRNARDFKCRTTTDDMKTVHQLLIDSDGLIPCGINEEKEADKLSNHQRFTERTRYLRRDNFRLSDRVFLPLSINQLFADSSYEMRVLTALVRHNTIGHKGIRIFDNSEGTIEPSMANILRSFVSACSKSVGYRAGHTHRVNTYENVGY